MTGEKTDKILIVDDVAENIDILKEALKDRYKVVAALSGEKALQIAYSDSPPDLILLDIIMPEMDGYSLLKKLKENEITADLPVIFITAKDHDSDEEEGLKLGAVDYITKPFSPAIVRARVKTQLYMKRYRNDLEEMIDERTIELKKSNTKLEEEMAARILQEKYNSIMQQGKHSNLEQMAIGLAHEINQPLTYINTIVKSAIDKLERDKFNPEKMIIKFTKTTKQVDRIIELTDHLRALRFSNEISHEQVDWRAVIDNTEFVLTDELNQNNIIFKNQITDSIPSTLGDKRKLEQVFINLAKNSIAAMSNQDNGEISISVIQEAEELVVLFTDNGPGMRPDVREQIFEPFFTTTGHGKGAGIGMGIVSDIVSEHHGTIVCESGLGEGTTFKMTFPIDHSKL